MWYADNDTGELVKLKEKTTGPFLFRIIRFTKDYDFSPSITCLTESSLANNYTEVTNSTDESIQKQIKILDNYLHEIACLVAAHKALIELKRQNQILTVLANNVREEQWKAGNVIKGRVAECSCGKMAISEDTLPFFKEQPEQDTDKFYCGHHGWE